MEGGRITTTATSAGGVDVFLLRLTSGGSAVWKRQFGGPANDQGNNVAFDKYGDVFVGGSTDGRLGTGLTTGFGGYDLYLAKFSSGGTLQ